MSDFKPLSLEEIQREQDKHKVKINRECLNLPIVDHKQSRLNVANNKDVVMDYINKVMSEVSRETELWTICEMAKQWVLDQKQTGEWVVVGRAAYGYVDIECPCCKYLRQDMQADNKPNFCENCGADMRKGGAE